MVMEAMKMQHSIAAATPGIVRGFVVEAGETVFEGAKLAFIEERPELGGAVQEEKKIDLDYIRPDLAEVLERATDSVPRFLHGTSTVAWEHIQRQGLAPRAQSGARPAYGAHLSRAAKSDERCVYLTTQLGAASWAANDAARVHGGEPIILEVDASGIDEARLAGDEDSESESWRESMHRMGCVKHLGRIDPKHIRVYTEK
jgi:pyruvate/2-oxoglutarate dehydrogenase complex dihydrolipoamide acyltransferase (E2) component